ncbi:uncharacterized protein [Drosophila kikkawai]|uniref:Uncharacterized protein n=1 Tax=Drosophila kikkawai TaxID=30033 RepID=A0ABM3C495_DROKI|nr:uncharacterized protein LOC121501851 [Drosophila kikkawai]
MPAALGSFNRPMIDRSSPAAVRTTEKYLWTGTPNASTSSLPPLPSRLTLAPVSNRPVSCWPKMVIPAKGLGSEMPPRCTAATTSLRFSLRFRNRSLAFRTVRDTWRIPHSWCCLKILFLASKYLRMRSSYGSPTSRVSVLGEFLPLSHRPADRFPRNSDILGQQYRPFHIGSRTLFAAPARNRGIHGLTLRSSSIRRGTDFVASPGLPRPLAGAPPRLVPVQPPR